nr:DNA mismatch endonuclease Vsr [Propionibacterium sp.]
MVDSLTPERRSRLMARVRQKNTGPELALRAALRAAGLVGYRLHRRDLPGRPDLAYGRWRVAVFVDGAFWHGKRFDRDRASQFWRDKIDANVARDERVDSELAAAGWVVLRFSDIQVKADLRGCVGAVDEALASAGRIGDRRDAGQRGGPASERAATGVSCRA